MRFHSVTRPEFCYQILYENNYSRKGDIIDDHFHEYWAGTDGLTQHASRTYVQTERWVDFFASLAMYLQEPGMLNRTDEHMKTIADLWPRETYHKKIDFFLELRHDEKKKRFYEKGDLKTSTAPTKANDRRWEPVPTWADGGITAAMQFLACSWYGSLERFALYLQVRERFYELNNWYGDDDGDDDGNGIGYGKRQDFRDLQTSFRCVSLLVDAYRAQEDARRSLERLKHNFIDRQNAEPAELLAATA